MRDPNRASSLPAIGPTRSIATVEGTMKSPAAVTEAPNPNPVLAGVSTNWGSTMNDEYIPAPSSSATRFVVHTGRSLITLISTSGWRATSSVHPQVPSSASPTAAKPSVCADPHRQVGASLTASSSATGPADSSAAAVQLIRAGAL